MVRRFTIHTLCVIALLSSKSPAVASSPAPDQSEPTAVVVQEEASSPAAGQAQADAPAPRTGIEARKRQLTGIVGTVVDLLSGDPIEGAVIEVASLPYGNQVGEHVETSAIGAYIFPCPAGSYTVEARAAGYVPQRYEGSLGGGYYGYYSGAQLVTPVEVISGSITPSIDFSLALAGTVEGRITDWNQDPVTGYVYSWFSSYSAGADGNGDYSLSGLLEGTHYLEALDLATDSYEFYLDLPFVGGGWGLRWAPGETSTPVAVTSGGTTTGVDIQLDQPGGISGEVRDEDLLPVGTQCLVRVWDEQGHLFGGFETDPLSGEYYFYSLPPGCYFLRAECSGLPLAPQDYPGVTASGAFAGQSTGEPVTVVAGSTAADIDFALEYFQTSEVGSISGTVLDHESNPISGVKLFLGPLERDAFETVWAHQTDAAGEYEFPNIFPGFYRVWLGGREEGYVDELYDDVSCPYFACDPNDGTFVEVVAGSATTGIDFELAEGGAITGTITVPGRRVRKARVEVISPGLPGWTDRRSPSFLSVLTDFSGAYTLLGLPAGDVRVRAVARVHEIKKDQYYLLRPTDLLYIPEMYGGVQCQGLKCDVAAGAPVTVVPGATAGYINIELDPGGSIEGKVTWGSPIPLPVRLATVRAWTSAGEDTGIWDLSDAAGAFNLTGLPTGNYFVTADTRGAAASVVGEAYADVPCPAMTCDPTTATPVGVLAGTAHTSVNLNLSAGGRISGVVSEDVPHLPAIPVVTVSATDASGHVFGSDITDCSGFYEIQGLPTGSFYVFTTNHRGPSDEVWDDVLCGGNCLAAGGTPVAVTQGAETSGIDFILGYGIFKDGFESGDTSAW